MLLTFNYIWHYKHYSNLEVVVSIKCEQIFNDMVAFSSNFISILFSPQIYPIVI